MTAPGPASAPSLEPIFRSLAAFQRRPECADLLQFRSLVGAHQYRRLVRLVHRYLPPGASALDWGCGSGHFSYTLLALGYRVSGFSFVDFGLRAQLPGPYEFVRGDEREPTRLPLPDGAFDGAVSVGVLEHVRETGGTEVGSMRELARVLAPGGIFICYHFPNRYSWIDAMARLIPGAHRHPYRYTASQIEELCSRSGFECIAIHRYGALPRNLWHLAPRALRDSPFIAQSGTCSTISLASPSAR
ncbi:MAG: class I SAM-dependent methyltransferase [Gemmatimonadaceae bacterium]